MSDAATKRAILHVDMDAFYASVEQRDAPELRGTPVIVGGNGQRGVVAAASYEARRHGVHSAMPMRRARQLCPQATVVRPRMAHYQAVSRQVFEILEQFTPVIEGLSLDEAFLDVTHSLALFGDALSIAREIKRRITEQTQLTASVGVAENKLIAKIASDLEKPDGLTVILGDQVRHRLDALPVKRLPGLGRKKGDELLAAGIRTFADLRTASDEQLRPLFGKDAQRQRERAAGIDHRPVVAHHRMQSLSAETTFDRDISDTDALRQTVLALADKAGTRLRQKQLNAGTVQVKIREHNFQTFIRQRQLVPATCDTQAISQAAAQLLMGWCAQHPGARIRLLGVGATDLTQVRQPDLFSASATQVSALDRTIDDIRERFGTTAVYRGSPRAR